MAKKPSCINNHEFIRAYCRRNAVAGTCSACGCVLQTQEQADVIMQERRNSYREQPTANDLLHEFKVRGLNNQMPSLELIEKILQLMIAYEERIDSLEGKLNGQ